MRNNVAILTLLIIGGTACGQQVKQEAPKTVQEEPMAMSPDKAYQLWKEKPQEVVILDVRTPGEYQSGHVKGATNLDYYANFEAEVQKLPKDKIYFYSIVPLDGAAAKLRPSCVSSAIKRTTWAASLPYKMPAFQPNKNPKPIRL
jgi:hypothetical protein